LDLREALGPPLDVVGLLAAFSELSLTRGVEQSPYHHLDSFEHTLEVVRGVQRELGENLLGPRVCRDRVERLRLAAALHLKIGFMRSDRTDYHREARPGRRPLRGGLTVVSWADRLAAQCAHLKREHVERHEALCAKSLNPKQEPRASSRPELRGLTERLTRDDPAHPASVSYAASRLRLLVARGMDEQTALAEAPRLL
jgi:poly(A) polymerase